MTNDPWGTRQSGAVSGIGQAADPWFGSSQPRLVVSTRPPMAWLFSSLAASVIAGVLAGLFGQQISYALIGWVLSGPIALLLLAVFTWRETERRSQATAIVYGWLTALRVVALVAALAAVLGSAVRIAFWAGRNFRWFG